MIAHPLSVLYEDNHLLIVDKPAGLPTMGVASEQESLVTQAKAYIKATYRKPGNVYLGVVSRLDSMVSGVIVLARTSKSAARLSEQFRRGLVAKRYWAIVEPMAEPDSGSLDDWLVKDEQAQRMRVLPNSPSTNTAASAVRAMLAYRTIGSFQTQSLLEIEPSTGRKHQIRVQLASRGWPIWGDRKYGGRPVPWRGIALHSVGLRLMHPTKSIPLTFRSPPPTNWRISRFAVDFRRETLNLE